MFGKPPEIVPDGFTAREYFELGIWYEEKRLLGQARESFSRAIALEPVGSIAIESKRFLHTRIPRNDVPTEAIERLRLAEPQLGLKPEVARKAAEKLIVEYPDFEWPHRLLADFHLRHGDVARCLTSLQNALKINPDYAQAAALMAQALTVDMEYETAADYLRRAMEAMPNDNQLRSLQRGIEVLTALDEEGGSTVF